MSKEKSGFTYNVIKREDCKWPEHLVCHHDCDVVIQLVSNVSGELDELQTKGKEQKRQADES